MNYSGVIDSQWLLVELRETSLLITTRGNSAGGDRDFDNLAIQSFHKCSVELVMF